MEDRWRDATAAQFGAAIDMLERAIGACPDALWSDRTRTPEFWYVAFHVVFWLDYYLSESEHDFTPPAPYGVEELDPAGVLPPRVYTREEILAYLAHARAKCHARLDALTPAEAQRAFRHGSVHVPVSELLLYNLRHLQHHVGQLYMVLRQETGEAPRWVTRGAGSPPVEQDRQA
jgi:hypothetical protein